MRRSSYLPWLIAPALVWVFYPVLKLPFVVDDVYLFSTLRDSESLAIWERFRTALTFCTQSDFFRPLCAPFFLLSYGLFGATPVPLRALILLLQIAGAFGVYLTARKLLKSDLAAWIACFLYAFSWIQWTTLSMFTNLGQAAAHALFWTALWIYLNDLQADTRRAPWTSLMLITAAVFFREDAAVFPLFAAAAGFVPCRSKTDLRALVTSCSAFFPWTAVYLALRLAVLPRSPISPDTFLRFDWRGIFDWRAYPTALGVLLQPFWTCEPSAYIRHQLAASIAAHTSTTAVWAAGIVLFGAGLTRELWLAFERRDESVETSPVAGLALFTALGFFSGLFPYTLYRGSIEAMDCHRFALSWGALSIGIAGALDHAAVRFRALRQGFAFATAACGLWLFAGAALLVRFPDPSLGPFLRLNDMKETRDSISAVRNAVGASLRENDEMIFIGFRPLLFIPQLFQLEERIPLRILDTAAPPPPSRYARWTIERLSSGNGSVEVRATRVQPAGGAS